jgi:hypothetical protein
MSFLSNGSRAQGIPPIPVTCYDCGQYMFSIYDRAIRETCDECGGEAKRDSRAALELIRQERDKNENQ